MKAVNVLTKLSVLTLATLAVVATGVLIAGYSRANGAEISNDEQLAPNAIWDPFNLEFKGNDPKRPAAYKTSEFILFQCEDSDEVAYPAGDYTLNAEYTKSNGGQFQVPDYELSKIADFKSVDCPLYFNVEWRIHWLSGFKGPFKKTLARAPARFWLEGTWRVFDVSPEPNEGPDVEVYNCKWGSAKNPIKTTFTTGTSGRMQGRPAKLSDYVRLVAADFTVPDSYPTNPWYCDAVHDGVWPLPGYLDDRGEVGISFVFKMSPNPLKS